METHCQQHELMERGDLVVVARALSKVCFFFVNLLELKQANCHQEKCQYRPNHQVIPESAETGSRGYHD